MLQLLLDIGKIRSLAQLLRNAALRSWFCFPSLWMTASWYLLRLGGQFSVLVLWKDSVAIDDMVLVLKTLTKYYKMT